MKKYTCLFLVILLAISCFGQPSLKKLLQRYNTESIPYLSTDSLAHKSNVFLLDTREEKEYKVSHLQGAIFVGYDYFDLETVTSKIADKKAEIIVYCSVGIRSEDIGEKLKAAGYTNVKNLYGGIFEWKNKNNPVYDSINKKTNNVHAYSKYWGKLLTNAEKIY